MTHSATMVPNFTGKTILEALNTDLVCDAINTAMRELFLQSFTVELKVLSPRMDFQSVLV